MVVRFTGAGPGEAIAALVPGGAGPGKAGYTLIWKRRALAIQSSLLALVRPQAAPVVRLALEKP
eukprot:6802911-Alexandrium_andersonii.AAC.1